MNCPACGTPIVAGQTFCPACRERGRARVAAPPPVARDRNERLFLVIACVFAAGALALPRLRKSTAFGPKGKAVLGGCAVLNTAGAVLLLGAIIFLGPHYLMKYIHFLRRGY